MTEEFYALVDYPALVARIYDMIEETGLLKKDVCMACGITPSAFSDKCQQRNNRFNLDEIHRLSDFFQRRLNKRLPLWPLVSLEHATALAALNFPPSGAAKDR